MRSILLVYFLTMVFTLIQAVKSDEKRGVARIMQVDSNELNKRADRGTWYTGKDLKKAACFSRNGLPNIDAHVNDMVGAMAMHGFEQCHKCMQVTNTRDRSKKIIVQIIDKCAACKVNKHIDLTPGAFRKLSGKGRLAVGVLDISFKPVKCPNHGIFRKLRKLM
ncbi:uncharacterized protein B0P05DRAFT_568851 [Gilbertella persicaria]|uniref:Barwin domain-containing protein n=1 Tax=Rhizopus stolonifer TaxID=4846 RepID=A0A367IQN7_RHIST|nr:uncharacterized protein B0P05DRAFT_568851 [Gilbertella persicaria]KAI8090885.1 hypothetical protein B0P05DRAFT_568851 [Gilbertella persicaria]RCH79998.1 hypothetical protein CU098_006186 [Rhizopus stolonifer]